MQKMKFFSLLALVFTTVFLGSQIFVSSASATSYSSPGSGSSIEQPWAFPPAGQQGAVPGYTMDKGRSDQDRGYTYDHFSRHSTPQSPYSNPSY